MPDEDLKTLGLKAGASQDDIRRAFRKLAKEHHPDRGGSHAEFLKLKAAYERLIAGKGTFRDAHYTRDEVPDWRSYDPFADRYYDSRRFFQPVNPALEGFERHERAKERRCNRCLYGTISAITDQVKGYTSLEERLCGCQLLE